MNWVKIKETNNRYSISDTGLIRKEKEKIIRSNGRSQIINKKILTPIPNPYGYLKVRCRVETNVCKNIYIHSLVANYFVDGKEDGKQVNHIDGNKLNNHFSNLEWVTPKENINHAWKLGLSKPTNKKPVIYNNVRYDSMKDLCMALGTNMYSLRKMIKDDSFRNLHFA